MDTRNSFDYAVIRVVPRVERAEFINAGVILFCLTRQYLDCRIHLDETRLRALWPCLEDIESIHAHLNVIPGICSGDRAAGPIAQLSKRERFHWLVSPRSTVIQVSPVHTGLCSAPDHSLDRLFRTLVLCEKVLCEEPPARDAE